MKNQYEIDYQQGYDKANEEWLELMNKLRAEIAKYGSIWVEYQITGRRDKDIEQLVRDVLSQAKKQVIDVIDKYKAERTDNE